MTPQRQSLDTASQGVASLVLVRHGESEGNLADRAALDAGQPRLDLDLRDADVPLSETGRRQARAVHEYLQSLPEDERPTAVVSSPYRRACEPRSPWRGWRCPSSWTSGCGSATWAPSTG